MKHVKKSVLLWYSPHEMYALVTAVADYPKFLPWCERAEVLEQHDGGMTARLHLSYAGVRHAFTTRNEHQTDRSVVIGLLDVPFSKLDGTWLFIPIGHRLSSNIEVDILFGFPNGALDAVVSLVLD